MTAWTSNPLQVMRGIVYGKNRGDAMSSRPRTPKEIVGLGLFCLITGSAMVVLPFALSKTLPLGASKGLCVSFGVVMVLTGIIALIDGFGKIRSGYRPRREPHGFYRCEKCAERFVID